MLTKLHHLSLPELKKLQKDIAKAVSTFEARQKAMAMQQLDAKAKEMGYSLSELLSDRKVKTKRPPVDPKYKNPKKSDQTWSGRGRQPRWLTVELSRNGGNLEDFLIQSNYSAVE